MKAFSFILTAKLVSALLAAVVSHAVFAAEPPAVFYARVAEAETRGVKFLLAQIGEDGAALGEPDPDHPQNGTLYGGRTALCVYALRAAGVDAKHPDIQRAVQWLLKAKLTGTYAVALRTCALAEMHDDNVPPAASSAADKGESPVAVRLKKDVAWLLRAASNSGAYTYTSANGKRIAEYDNSNAQMAVLGVWTAAQHGVDVPPQYWALVEKHWLLQQQPDGGWGYFARPAAVTKTYGSMTAAGLATLYITFDTLHREDFLRCKASAENKPIADGLKWLTKNMAIDQNPKLGENRYYYWLYTLSRVGLASGFKQFGGVDWYARGGAELIRRQNPDGSWDYDDERLPSTAFALLFLTRGRDPVVMNKLAYKGQWNARPRDIANLATWMSLNFERSLKWQIVDFDADLTMWHDAQILYISGAAPVEFTPEQIDKLRLFLLQGGTIISEAACANADFTLDMSTLYRQLFDRYEMKRLDENHPLYTLHSTIADKPGLLAVSNGVRVLAVHCPQELSLGLQLGPDKANRPTFDLATNMFMYFTDRAAYRQPGQSPWPTAKTFKPKMTLRLTPVIFSGNYMPEPLAWKRLAILIGNRHEVQLDVDDPIDIASLDPQTHPVALLSGEGAFELTASQAEALRNYLADGGRLLVEASGGSRAFDESAQKQLQGLFGQGLLRQLAPSHRLFKGPENAERVTYRSDFATTLSDRKNDARVLASAIDGEVGILYFPEDLTMGLLGANIHNLRGYSQQSAVDLATNAIWLLSGK